jgi:protein SCO1/2
VTALERIGPTPRRQRIVWATLVTILFAVAAIQIGALWHVFGPHTDYAPDFTLTDQDGRPFTLSAQRGHPVVLFFGYTHCPDTCPTTLAHLARALRSPRAPQDARVAFVSVDPDRDSPTVLKRYVALFDPRFYGLTGSAKALDLVETAYHTWHERLPAKHGGDYEVAHGAAIYFIDRRGTLRGIGDWSDDTPALRSDLEKFA